MPRASTTVNRSGEKYPCRALAVWYPIMRPNAPTDTPCPNPPNTPAIHDSRRLPSENHVALDPPEMEIVGLGSRSNDKSRLLMVNPRSISVAVSSNADREYPRPRAANGAGCQERPS